MAKFELVSDFDPKGDQPVAIKQMTDGVREGLPSQVLMGVTGSGKTFSMANTIANVNRPTLILAPNKTLAAQLFNEFRQLFPHNAVEYFVSYYDYYQPEAYMPVTDTYIDKETTVNDRIDRLRHSATRSILERRDVIIVASVSCIYGIGSPDMYLGMAFNLETGQEICRDDVLRRLIDMQYERNDYDFSRGVFRVRGDTIEIFPTYEDSRAVRIEFFGDEIESISFIDPLRGSVTDRLGNINIYPGSHFAMPTETKVNAIDTIKEELELRLAELKHADKLLEAQRLEQRTNFDIEMIREMGYCSGIENYSRHFTRRKAGEPPPTLVDYFPDDFLVFIDESHVTVPQLRGMYRGDRSRKMTLLEYGFRLPSALDNRPLRFEEFYSRVNQVVYVSATPAEYELGETKGVVVEQVIRPTGLMDPQIELKPAGNQVDDLQEEIRRRVEKGERVLVTTLTKRMAENLTDYYDDLGIRVRYLHSDIVTLERMEIIRLLRQGEFDVLVGINLLREGLDIPEVSLVAILDADKEGFLRSARSLIQTCGRASRNVNGKVIMYCDKITKSIDVAVNETNRRRKIQDEFNRKNKITPKSIVKSLDDVLSSIYEQDYVTVPLVREDNAEYYSPGEMKKKIVELRKSMQQAAKDLRFEDAARFRDEMKKLEEIELALG
jgi:excinuclease ABC subunit B